MYGLIDDYYSITLIKWSTWLTQKCILHFTMEVESRHKQSMEQEGGGRVLPLYNHDN